MSIKTEFGTVVVDTNLVPYMRSREIEFTARNLKPYKIASLFFDDVVVNQFCQTGNKVQIDAKKILTISSNTTTAPSPGQSVFQGSSVETSTFSAVVSAYTSSPSTLLTLRELNGNFDETAPLYIRNNSITYANVIILNVTDVDTSDSFYPGEGVITPQSNVFAKVIATSGDDVIYLNQNYHNINVVATSGSSLSEYTNKFKVGDIVFQTTNGENRYDLASYRGYVEYVNFAQGAVGYIAIKPIDGILDVKLSDTNTTSNVRLWSVSDALSPKPLHAQSINLNGFPVNAFIKSIANSANIKITSYSHTSGVLANTRNNSLTEIILPTSSNTNTAAGNLIYFTSGTGVGVYRLIRTVDGSMLTLDTPLEANYGSNTNYSIGNFVVDDTGTSTGIFHVPAFPNFKFKTGTRIFTVTDTSVLSDPDYTMRAAASFMTSGILKTTQRIQTTPTLQPLPEVDSDALVRPVSPAERSYNNTSVKKPVSGSTGSTIPRISLGDGLSQTFFTPKPIRNANKQDYGMFISSVDLFFKNKPSVALGSMQLPITVKIAEVQNGFPTKNYLASKTIQAKDVKISNSPSISNLATVTKFYFDDPVYLEPAREYAIVIGSDSPDYEVYIAELGQNVLGAVPDRRISEQPYSGSFFRSQNSSTWTPYQNQDLMFVINKCVFNTSLGEATFNLNEAPKSNTFVDKVTLVSSDLQFPVTDILYELKGVYANNIGNEYESGNGIELTNYSSVEYGTLLDKSNKTSINRRKLLKSNSDSYLMKLSFSSPDLDISPIVNIERLGLTASRYLIDNAGIQNNVIALSNFGSGYNAVISIANVTAGQEKVIGTNDGGITANAAAYRQYVFANNASIGFYAVSIVGGGGSGAAGFAVANTDGQAKVNYIVITNPGSGYLTNPTISIVSGNATSNSNATAIINGETSKSGGNIQAKYITREIVLEDGFESGDIRVFMDAVRATGTDINVYYKVKSEEDNDRFIDKSWQLMLKQKNIFSKDARSIIGLEFRPNLLENKLSYVENGITYPVGGKFKSFAIKVCLTSSDPSLVPKIRNLRIIATPEG